MPIREAAATHETCSRDMPTDECNRLSRNSSPPFPLPWLYAGASALLAAVAVHAALSDTPAYLFTRDPAAIHEADPFLGAVSNLGIVLWAFAAGIALFAFRALRGTVGAAEPRALFASFGVFTLWLLLDDLFMLHERVLPDEAGIPQPLIVALYALTACGLIARYRAVVAASDYRPLALALLLFGCSVGVDQGPGAWHAWPGLALVEDGAKLLGIVSWLAWVDATAAAALSGRLSDPALYRAGSPFRSRIPAAFATSRADSPSRAARGSSPAGATRGTPGSPLTEPPRNRTAD